MLIDRFGRNVGVGDWFIRMDQNDEGRIYTVEDYPKAGYITVHEHVQDYSTRGKPDTTLAPKRLQQTIKMPRSVIWYPRELLPKVVASE